MDRIEDKSIGFLLPAYQSTFSPRKASIVVAFPDVDPLALWLLLKNQYLSQTRAEKWISRVASRRSLEVQPVLSQRRLTANPHDAPLTSGVISLDGKYLAYSDPTGLYLPQVDSGETISVPLPKGFDAMPESWFPDSVHLVASHFDDLEKKSPSLWEISVVGGTPRKLTDGGSSARVSPDGSKIAFLRGKWGDEEIWLIDTDKNIATKIGDGGGDHLGRLPGFLMGRDLPVPECLTASRPLDLVCASRFLTLGRGRAKRFCRIFDSALPWRG
jgi:dipeptidyl aminopeptidase/acylaminoacyl peptidase